MDLGELGSDPLAAFARWLAEATTAGVAQADAAVLATATPDGRPSARAVLVRGIDARGVAFYTNRRSRKGRELAANPRAALCLVWPAVHRQVRIEGTVAPSPDDESDRYWTSRPYESRLSAVASPQSRVVAARSELDDAVAALRARHPEADPVPRPDWWGGYLVRPVEIEFWQGHVHRLHDRIRYRRTGEGWQADRLAP